MNTETPSFFPRYHYLYHHLSFSVFLDQSWERAIARQKLAPWTQPGSAIYKSYTHKGKATWERRNKEKGV